MRTSVGIGATALLAASLIAGCGARGTTSPTESSSPTTGASASSPQPAPASGRSNGQTYTVSTISSSETNAGGNGTWTLNLQTISGGDPKVADTFNTAVKTVAQQQLAAVRRDADADPARPWHFDTTPQISFSPAAVSEVITGLFMADKAAHPINTVGTVVIDARSATPITLKNLFTDEQKGLDRLSEQTKQLLPAVMGIGPAPMADEPGNAPVEANFENWIPTPGGIQVTFKDYQFAHGQPVLTIPWSAVDDLLAPGMTALR